METQYSLALSLRSDELWKRLKDTSLIEAAASYLKMLSPHTQRAYRNAYNSIFRLLEDRGMLSSKISLQDFSLCNLENLLDCIRKDLSGSEATKQQKAGAFIALTRFLDRSTQGMIRTVKPITGTYDATFKKIRDKSVTQAITHAQWDKFICALKRISFRDYLIARATFQGAKRISEILNATIDQIDWENKRITYFQSKSALISHKIIISYSDEFMNELKHYLYDRHQGYIFITREGGKVSQPHVYRAFAAASQRASLPLNVHPHMLRTTAVTLLMKMGYHSDDVMKVSGHTTPAAVLYYDKTPDEENVTTKVSLI